MGNKVHIVPHMHWDREWYFTAEESQYLLLNNMEEIFERLENDESYPCYILDGQTAVLEDYFAYKPEARDRLKKLVEKGKLRIGPWYTQTDAMVVGGESIVRNLLYGIKDCKDFGAVMKIGYLPDSFGQSAQMPMILNGFGITRSMFWRGTSERMGSNKTEFYHVSPDGSKVLCQVLPLGYAIGKYLPTDLAQLKKRMEKYIPVLDKGATSNHIIVPNGHDQMPIQKNIFEVIESLKKIYPERDFFLSDYESVFEELEKKQDYDVLEGEFLDGRYMRVHRSIFSSRADIKSINTHIENKLTNILEPLASIAHSLGFEYFSGAFEEIWKLIMKNHAHDSIGCCCSDKVHREIMMRFELAEEKIDRLIDFYKRKITDAMSCEISLDKLCIFNTCPYERKKVIRAKVTTRMKGFDLLDVDQNKIEYTILKKEIVDAGIIDRQIVHYGNYDPFICYTIEFYDQIPAMGYKNYFIQESEEKEIDLKTQNHLENKFFKVEIQSNGALIIYDKKNNQVYKDVLLVEDGADDGDGYDYSPAKNDWIITSKDVKASIDVQHSTYSDNAKVSFVFNVPEDLESRKNKLLNSQINVSYDILLAQDSDTIKFKYTIDNHAKDHRVRLYIPTCIASKMTLADNQFGQINRSIKDEAMNVWESENWSERPDAIYPMLSYVKMDKDPLTFLTNSIREYEAINEQLLAITLFRSTGYLGKEDLLRRPGRPSGIKLETPDQQMIKINSYDFAITVSQNEYAAKKAKEYLTPLISYNKMPFNAMKLNPSSVKVPYRYSMLSIQTDTFILTACKQSEDQTGYIIRGYNAGSTDLELRVESQYEEFVTNLNEEPSECDWCVKPSQVKTVKLK